MFKNRGFPRAPLTAGFRNAAQVGRVFLIGTRRQRENGFYCWILQFTPQQASPTGSDSGVSCRTRPQKRSGFCSSFPQGLVGQMPYIQKNKLNKRRVLKSSLRCLCFLKIWGWTVTFPTRESVQDGLGTTSCVFLWFNNFVRGKEELVLL